MVLTTERDVESKKDKRRWMCRKCEYVGRDRTDTKRHVESQHLRLRPWKCTVPDCEWSFEALAKLRRHMRLVHPGMESETENPTTANPVATTCSICDETFATRAVHDTHVKSSHTSDTGRLECPHCSKTFAKKVLLERHLQTMHENRRMFECLVCHTRFGRKDYLHKHQEQQSTCNKSLARQETKAQSELLYAPSAPAKTGEAWITIRHAPYQSADSHASHNSHNTRAKVWMRTDNRQADVGPSLTEEQLLKIMSASS